MEAPSSRSLLSGLNDESLWRHLKIPVTEFISSIVRSPFLENSTKGFIREKKSTLKLSVIFSVLNILRLRLWKE
jgi:hypothetical protein